MDIKRNIALDSLRGIAAIGIVLWHYSNFYEIAGPFDLPFSNTLAFFYKLGWTLVDFFFCLSGYVFFRFYFVRIKTKQIYIKEFLILRISRLYPLILLTLICAALLSYMLLLEKGKFYIHKENDIFAFFANLFFLQSGFFSLHDSFNAPSWSVGIEFWVYLAFFFLASNLKKGMEFACMLIALFFMAALNNGINFGLIIFSAEFERGLSSFFLGGLTYFFIEKISTLKTKTQNYMGWTMMSVVIFICVLLHLRCSNNHSPYIDSIVSNEYLLITLILNPLLIISVCISPNINKIIGIQPFKFLGEISYSIYLWHIPIQLLIFWVVFSMNLSLKLESPIFFLGYFLIVLLTAYVSSRFIEIPLKNMLRSKLLNK